MSTSSRGVAGSRKFLAQQQTLIVVSSFKLFCYSSLPESYACVAILPSLNIAVPSGLIINGPFEISDAPCTVVSSILLSARA